MFGQILFPGGRENGRRLLCLVHDSEMLFFLILCWDEVSDIFLSLLLSVQAGQYTSIFVDNSAGAPITIQNGSDFMGMLMGA